MPQANLQNTTPSNISAKEALFLRCILQCQNDYGMAPPVELGLPKSIGVVVDYDYVKRMMFTKMLRDDDNTEEGRNRHRERTKSAIKRARQRLMHLRVIGCHDPWIWWSGRPVRGIKETEKNDRYFGPPFVACRSSDKPGRQPSDRPEREPMILRAVEEGFTDDGRPVTRCIVVSGHSELGLCPLQNG
jgi:hypothetical protein